MNNKKSYLLEQVQSITEWKNQDDITFLNQTNPDGSGVTKETWKIDKEQNLKLAQEALDNINELIADIDEKLIKLDK